MRRLLVVIAVVVVAGAVVLAAVEIFPHVSGPSGLGLCATASGISVSVEDDTSLVDGPFAGGAIQAFGANATATLLGGLSYYYQNATPYDSLPAAETLPTTGGSGAENLTPLLAPYFPWGGIYPVAWNGTAWLIAGQATFGQVTEGAAVALTSGRVTNLTPLLGSYFSGQGIWIAGWDGQGWLIGGNSSSGASLVYLEGGKVTNLSGLLPNNQPGDWVQMVAWNGTAWLVGGQGVFGSWEGGQYVNLLPSSPFAKGGVFGIGWNGNEWLVGGDPPLLVAVQGVTVSAGPSLENWTHGWINTVVPLSFGWAAGGGAFVAGGGYTPRLELFGGSWSPGPTDLSSCLPASFAGGWVQFGGVVPGGIATSLLLVGEGGTNPTTLASHGAAANLSISVTL